MDQIRWKLVPEVRALIGDGYSEGNSSINKSMIIKKGLGKSFYVDSLELNIVFMTHFLLFLFCFLFFFVSFVFSLFPPLSQSSHSSVFSLHFTRYITLFFLSLFILSYSSSLFRSENIYIISMYHI